MANELILNIDYYLDELGRMVFTETYHLKRGYCCGNDCKHCPWKDDREIDSETSSE
ncbi:MAG: hypothetical protein IT271_11540 [Chitinophagales bacterium]|nr:hypothetical protein [Chitinophagales bacterium]